MMKFQPNEFEYAIGTANQMKPSDLPEIVFSGKSNVGKSSLINKLTNRKGLARVSASPGKTATINFYRLPECRFVDLPGYGYAKVSKSEKRRWADLVDAYLRDDRNIKLLVQILDARHAPTQNDIDMLNFLLETERNFLVVCTKCDKLNKTETEKQRKIFEEIFAENEIPFIFFSATKGTGLEEIREQINRAVEVDEGEQGMVSDCLSVRNGHLYIGDCDTTEVVAKYGSPLYVMDENKIRDTCRKYVQSFQDYYQGNGVPTYASKAFNCKEICRIVLSEGLDLEVVSGGELYTALEAGVPADKIHFQGNNKSVGELIMAVENKVGDIVIDNATELKRIQQIAKDYNTTVSVSIRVKPGIDAHTHEFIRTGQIDSKFGTALETGEAFALVKETVQQSNLTLNGLHCHIGSQIMETEPFVLAAETMLDFYAEIKEKLNIELPTLNLGGGVGINYLEGDNALPYSAYMQAVSETVHTVCERNKLTVPRIILEPGRSIVGEAGITLYTVGDVKEIPGVRNYVAIDGGMFDNPRYALYQAEYTCLLANRMGETSDYVATIAGKCCESGDLIQENVSIPKPEIEDILAVLSTGAYNYSMSSNYNRNLKPPVIMVSGGESRVIVRGETYEDIVRNDI